MGEARVAHLQADLEAACTNFIWDDAYTRSDPMAHCGVVTAHPETTLSGSAKAQEQPLNSHSDEQPKALHFVTADSACLEMVSCTVGLNWESIPPPHTHTHTFIQVDGC